MPIAEASNFTQWFAVATTADATTDSTASGGTYDQLRITSSGLTPSVTTTQSAEIDPNRKAPADIRTNATGAGDLGIELSAQTYDELMRGVMMNDSSIWAAADDFGLSSSGYDLTAASGILDDQDGGTFAGIEVGDVVTISNADTPGNDGRYPVIELISSASIRLGHGLLWSEAASSLTDVTGDTTMSVQHESHIKIGSTKTPVWTERVFDDGVSADPVYREFYGYKDLDGKRTVALLSTFALSFTPGAISTGTFGVQGGFPAVGSGASALRGGADNTSTSPTTTVPINGLDDVKKIVLAQMASGSTVVNARNFLARTTEISFTYDNQIRDDAAVGAFGTVNTGLGTPTLSGSLNVYLYDQKAVDYLIANDQMQLSFICGDAVGNRYIFTFSEASITNAETPITGNNAATLANLSWSARAFTISRV